MADEIVTVGIKVETEGVERGSASLDTLAQKGDKAAKSIDTLGASADKANSSTEGLAQKSDRVGAALGKIGAGGDSAGKALGDVGKSADKAGASMDSIAIRGEKIGIALGKIGAAGAVAAFTALVTNAISVANAFEQIKGAAESAGTSVEQFSSVLNVAKVAGVGMGEVSQIMRELAKNVGEAEKPASRAAAAFRALKIDPKQFSDQAQLLQAVAKELGQYERGINKTILTQELLGRGAAQNASFLTDLANAGRLNASVTTEQADQAEKLVKSWRALSLTMEQWKNAIAVPVIEKLNEMIAQLQLGIDKAGGFWAALLRLGTANPFKSNADQAAGLAAQIDNLYGIIRRNEEILARPGARSGRLDEARARIADANAQIANLQKLREFYVSTDLAASKLDDSSVKLAGSLGKQAPAIAAAATAQRDLDSSYKSLLASLQLKSKLLGEEESLGRKLSESERTRITISETLARNQGALAAGQNKLTEVQKKALSVELDNIRVREEVIEKIRAEVELKKVLERVDADYLKTRIASIEAEAKAGASVDATLKRLREEAEEIGLTAQQLNILRAARLNDVDAQEIQRLSLARMEASSEGEVLTINRRIEALNNLIEARRDAASNANQVLFLRDQERVAEAAVAAWQKASDEIQRGLTDSLFRAAESGKSAFESLRSAIKGMFNNLVLRPIVNAAFSPISAGVAAAFGTGPATASTLGGFGNIASGFGSAANVISGGFNTFALSGVGQSLGLSQAAVTAAQAAELGISATSTLTSIGSTLSAAAPYLAAAVALYTLFAKSGETRSGAQYGFTSTTDLLNPRRGTSQVVVQPGTYLLEGPSGGPVNDAVVRDAISSVVGNINKLLTDFGSAASITAFVAGLETSGKGRGGVFSGGTLSTGARFGESGTNEFDGSPFELTSTRSPDAQTAVANFVTDLKQATIQALQAATDIPRVISDTLRGIDAEALTDQQLDALLQNIAAFKQLDDALDLIGGSIEGVFASVVQFVGGAQAATKIVSDYYAVTRTDSEKFADAVRLTTEAFGSLGFNLPTSIRAYRELVEGIDGSTEAGQLLQAQMMALAPTVGALAQQAEAFGISVSGVVERLTVSNDQIAGYWRAVLPAADAAVKEVELLRGAFESLGVALPESLQQYRALVEGMDTSTVAGANLQIQLGLLASDFTRLVEGVNEADSAFSRLIDRLVSVPANEANFFKTFGGEAGIAENARLLESAIKRSLQSIEVDPGSLNAFRSAEAWFDFVTSQTGEMYEALLALSPQVAQFLGIGEAAQGATAQLTAMQLALQQIGQNNALSQFYQTVLPRSEELRPILSGLLESSFSALTLPVPQSAQEYIDLITGLTDDEQRSAALGLAGAWANLFIEVQNGTGVVDQAARSWGQIFSARRGLFDAGEQISLLTQGLSADFTELGLSLPGTRAQFAALLNTFAGTETEARVEALLPLWLDLIGLQEDQADAARRAAQQAIDEANRMAKAIQDALRGVSDFVTGLFTSGDLLGLTPEQQLNAAESVFADVLGRAQGGDVEAIRDLPNISRDLLSAAEAMFAHTDGFLQIRDNVLAELSQLTGTPLPFTGTPISAPAGTVGDIDTAQQAAFVQRGNQIELLQSIDRRLERLESTAALVAAQ